MPPPGTAGTAGSGAAAGGDGVAGRSVGVADAVRAAILDGTHRPGVRLSEPRICAEVGASRNTLREAFRTLAEERLVVHELNRGVFVRVPTALDVAELYDCRRLVECAALGGPDGSGSTREGLARVEAVLRRARERAAARDWLGVGTADVDFHRALVDLSGSARVAAMMEGVWNELRLVFHAVDDPRAFHGAYLERNTAIAATLAAGRVAAARAALHAYLDDAEQHVLQVHGQRDAARR